MCQTNLEGYSGNKFKILGEKNDEREKKRSEQKEKKRKKGGKISVHNIYPCDKVH